MKAAILLVGEDEVLSYTRAQILSDLGVVVADPIEAPQLLRANAFDLLVFYQTVKDSTAKEIIAQAAELYPDIRVSAISAEGQKRRLDAITFTAEFHRPSRLRDVVAGLLNSATISAG